jgi:hypothetical protein
MNEKLPRANWDEDEPEPGWPTEPDGSELVLSAANAQVTLTDRKGPFVWRLPLVRRFPM